MEGEAGRSAGGPMGSGDGREGRGAAAARGGARRRPVPLLPRGGRAGTGRAAAACAGVSGHREGAAGRREGVGSRTGRAPPAPGRPWSRFSRSWGVGSSPPVPAGCPLGFVAGCLSWGRGPRCAALECWGGRGAALAAWLMTLPAPRGCLQRLLCPCGPLPRRGVRGASWWCHRRAQKVWCLSK